MIKSILAALSAREDLLLKVAVAFPLIWAGVSQITNPTNWIGFVPAWLGAIIPPETFLTIHSILNLVIGAGLLIGFWRILFSAAATLSLLSIIVFYGVDDITFRDVGLTLVALVLFLRALKKER